jgi:hypothetical protein
VEEAVFYALEAKAVSTGKLAGLDHYLQTYWTVFIDLFFKLLLLLAGQTILLSWLLGITKSTLPFLRLMNHLFTFR